MTPQAPHAAPGREDGPLSPRQCLSALLDGHAPGEGAQTVQRACALWRDDVQARQDWHAWHLIGDVMRSEELAQPPSRDAAFLARLHQRLAAEPVVLAPAPVSEPAAAGGVRRWRQSWLLPGAVAAGFVAVAGVMVVARTGPAPDTSTLASASAPALSLTSRPVAAPSSAPGAGGLIRDPQLDSYLRAHQAARGSIGAALPGGGMRNVEVTLSPGAAR